MYDAACGTDVLWNGWGEASFGGVPSYIDACGRVGLCGTIPLASLSAASELAPASGEIEAYGNSSV